MARGREEYEVVILGGGITGLTAGALMARGGLHVALVDGYPWEWWLHEDDDDPPLLNYSGGILYGAPGYQPVTSLLIELGMPPNRTPGEGPVSFRAVEPGLQVLLPGRWLNLYQGDDEIRREVDRVFPGHGEDLNPLLEKAGKHLRRAENYWSVAASGRRESRTSLSRFLDGWAAYWNAVFGGGAPPAARAIRAFGDGDPMAKFLDLCVMALVRRPPAEAGAQDLYTFLELLAQPYCLMNAGGQRGVFAALRDAFHRGGGAVIRAEDTVQLGEGRHGRREIYVGERVLESPWIVLDGPRREMEDFLRRLCPRLAATTRRPAIHLSWLIPSDRIPAGMGGHLVMDLDDRGAMIVSMAGDRGGRTLLEILAPYGGDDRDEEEVRSAAVDLRRRLYGLLRFLPDGLEDPAARVGDFPAFFGAPRFMDRLRSPGPAFQRRAFHHEGRAVFVGRGDYLGSSLNGALGEGEDLAYWIMRQQPGRGAGRRASA